jgi:hypothetical protein
MIAALSGLSELAIPVLALESCLVIPLFLSTKISYVNQRLIEQRLHRSVIEILVEPVSDAHVSLV